MLVGLTACGNKSDDEASYGLNFTSTEVQNMSEERATKDKLSKTSKEWLENATMFPASSEMSKRTYKDFVDFIGCDATEFKFDDSQNARNYTWIADGEDSSKLSVWFKEVNGKWCLSFSGSTNL